MDKPTHCLDDVRWREVGEEPAGDGWEENKTCPSVGEIRWVEIGNDTSCQLPIGEQGWMLFQPSNAYQNGWETVEEMEDSALIEVRILEQEKPPRKRSSYESVYYWAKVAVLRVVLFNQITQEFPESEPTVWPPDYPFDDVEVSIDNFDRFIHYHLRSQECRNWFVTTGQKPCRVILRQFKPTGCHDLLEICNCAFDIESWPHKVYKP
jgi:hypothetical protein